jgi:hypothetical protein
MATAFAGATVGFNLSSVLQNVLDGRNAEDRLLFSPNITLTDGTGANGAKSQIFDTRTLSASATEDLDLAGGLSDAFGNLITFTKIRALAITAAAANTNNVLVGGASATQLASLFSAVNDVLIIRPGGGFMVYAPDATGYTVTAGSADLLKIANSAGSTSVTYSIAIIGTT